jgi:acetyl esterase/lipase
VAPDYRLAPQTRFPGILEDCKSAIDFIQSSPLFKSAINNSVDSSRLIVSGSSAGGWLSLLAGTGIGYSACGLQPPSGISAVAAIYPITDLLDPFWTTKQNPVSYVGRVIGKEEVEPFISPLDVKAAFSPDGGRRSQFYSYMLQECVHSYYVGLVVLIDATFFF